MTSKVNKHTCKNCYYRHEIGRRTFCWCRSPEDMIRKADKCSDWRPQEAKQ